LQYICGFVIADRYPLGIIIISNSFIFATAIDILGTVHDTYDFSSPFEFSISILGREF
jgi:hypothetical protein